MKISHVFCCGLIALGAVACDDDGEGTKNETVEKEQLTLAVDASTVTLAAGETKTVNVTVKRPSTETNPATLTLIGAPADVTVSADPQATTGASTVTLKTSAATATQTFTITVLAQAGGLAATASIAVTIGGAAPIAVNGKVADGAGFPVVVTSVDVWSHGATSPVQATIAAGSTFSVSNVTPPYDVFVITDIGSALYFDLSTPTPTVLTTYGYAASTTDVHVQGQLGAAVENTRTTVAAYCGAGGTVNDDVSTDFSLNSFDGIIAEGDACTVSALRWSLDPESNNPSAFLAFESKPFSASLSSGSPASVDFALDQITTPVPSHSVALTLDVTPDDNEVELVWAPIDEVQDDILINASAPFVVPNGGRFFLSATGFSYSGTQWTRTYPVSETTSAVHVEAVPALAVDDAVSAQDVATLKVKAAASAPFATLCSLQATAGQFIVAANGDGFDYARMNARGLTLVPGTGFSVQCVATFSKPSTDALAAMSSINAIQLDSFSGRAFTVGINN